MTPFNKWLDNVMVDCNGCPKEMAIKHIREAAIAFCEQARVLIKTVQPAEVLDGLPVTIVLPEDYDVARVQLVTYCGREVTVKTKAELHFNSHDFEQQCDTPKHYYQQQIDQLILYPAPANVNKDKLFIDVAVKPARDASEIEDWFYSTHYEAIAHGAKARLMEIPEKPYSNPNLAAYHMSKFNDMAQKARASHTQGMGKRVLRTKIW